MVMVDPALFESEWFVDMDVSDRYMYLYLLMMSDNKIGSIEWNERMINFCANVPKKYKKEDIVRIFGGRIQEIPNHPNTLIIVDYVRFNWLKGGRELDEHKPLDKSIIKALSRYDLTVDSLNEMSKHKIKLIKEEKREVKQSTIEEIDTSVSDKDMDAMFTSFWNCYPSCSRKTNKKAVRRKFEIILGNDPNKAVSMFNKIMNGLANWMASPDWNKNGGEFICAPLVWLNQERWEAEIRKGSYGNKSGSTSANANYKSATASGIF